MSNAFNDVISEDDQSYSKNNSSSNSTSNTDNSQSVTDSFVTDASGEEDFNDGVRPTVKDQTSKNNRDRYVNEETGDKADHTDARGLFRKTTINELRYYAREGPYGRIIIQKPVNDSFKHGFDIQGDDEDGSLKSTFEQVIPKYKEAKIKSRRDGICVLMHLVGDSEQSVNSPISDSGGSFEGFQTWTVDNLSDELTDSKVAKNTIYDQNQVYVSMGEQNGGVALVDDITHPDHGEVIGYGVKERKHSDNTHTVKFIHADRCEHFVHGEHVDGQLGNNVTGKHIGESVLTPVLQPLKATQMGFWSIKEIFRRYSAPLHAIEPPESWSTDDFNDARDKMGDVSMASDAVLPPGSTLAVAEGVTDFDPKPFYETLVEAICAGTVFTKSVLQGTQTGSVAGSETDIKGYFSEIQVFRQQEVAPDLKSIGYKISTYDPESISSSIDVMETEFEWGPLFKLDDIQKAEGAVSLITSVTNGIKNYVVTPDEARSILSEQWATFDIDVDLDELSEDQMDIFDRINLNETGQGIKDNEEVNNRGNPQTSGTEGGRPQGSSGSQSNPTTDSSSNLDNLTTEQLEAELNRRNEN